MPFPLDRKYIDDAAKELGVTFPENFIQKMLQQNGGEAVTDDDDWNLHPFLDRTDNKRISRTCNHIGLETQKAKGWPTFPGNAISIGTNGAGDQFILMPSPANEEVLLDDIYVWYHATGDVQKVADSIFELVYTDDVD